MMTCKLIVQNLRKNIKDYSIYFITLTLAVAFFYAFNSISGTKSLKNLCGELLTMIDVLGKMIEIVSIVISVLISFLILYVNRFLLKRRKKELGIYMLLGMKKGKISRIFVGETFLVGVLSLVIGIVLGIFLSQLLTVAAIRLFGGHVNEFSMNFSMRSFKITVACFAVIYAIAMIFNIISISKVKLIDLLMAERKNEELKIRKNSIYIISFLVGVLFLALTAVCFKTDELLPQKEPLLAGLAFAVFATLLIFYSISSVVLIWLKKRKKYYFKDINSFFVRQIGSRIQGNFSSMSAVCILLTLTIILLTTGASIAITMSKLSKNYAPYDFVLLMDAKEKNIDVLKEAKEYKYGYDFSKITESYFQMTNYKSNITYGDMWKNQKVVIWEHDANLNKEKVKICSITEYNKCLISQGYKPIKLSENEFYINCNYKGTYQYMEEFLVNCKELTVAGTTLYPADRKLLKHVYQMTSIGDNDRGTLIVSDKVASKCTADGVYVQGFWKQGTDPEFANSMLSELTVHEDKSQFAWTSKVRMTTMYYSALGMPVFLFTYIGLIFLVICIALISAQQLTEISDNKVRYMILRKQGVSEKMIINTVYKQVGVYFISPLLLASVYTMFSMKNILNKVSDFYNMEIGTNIWIALAVLVLFYGGYYLLTSISCVSIISDRRDEKIDINN